jgi:hypothetical protein
MLGSFVAGWQLALTNFGMTAHRFFGEMDEFRALVFLQCIVLQQEVHPKMWTYAEVSNDANVETLKRWSRIGYRLGFRCGRIEIVLRFPLESAVPLLTFFLRIVCTFLRSQSRSCWLLAPTYPQVWTLIGYLLLPAVRKRSYTPTIGEMIVDYEDVMSRFQGRWARLWLRFCFFAWTVSVIVECWGQCSAAIVFKVIRWFVPVSIPRET